MAADACRNLALLVRSSDLVGRGGVDKVIPGDDVGLIVSSISRARSAEMRSAFESRTTYIHITQSGAELFTPQSQSVHKPFA